MPLSSADAISAMQKGTVLWKFGRRGQPHLRHFRISADCRRMEWWSPSKMETAEISSLLIWSIRELRLGQATAVFDRNRRAEQEHLSFSLVYEDRTLDLVAKERRDYEIWVTGLRVLMTSAATSRDRQVSGNFEDGNVTTRSNNLLGSDRDIAAKKTFDKLRQSFVSNGDLFTWGFGGKGQLGHGETQLHRTPKVVDALLEKDIRSVSCGMNHTAALTEAGEVLTWGEGAGGRLGHMPERDCLLPVLVRELCGKMVTAVECGDFHTMALLDNGEVYSWGNGDQGQLGHGNSMSQMVPKQISSLFGQMVIQIACGSYHSAAVTDHGVLWMWGENHWGQLGVDDKVVKWSPTALKMPPDKRVARVACGCWHSACVTDDGEVYTWGNGSSGQLGHGNKDSSQVPVRVAALANSHMRRISCGRKHTAAVSDKDSVYMWGSGFLGNAKETQETAPVVVKALEGRQVQNVVCGAEHTAALTVLGELYIWGNGLSCRLGIGDEKNHLSPLVLEGLAGKKVWCVALGDKHSAAVCAHMWLAAEDTGDCMNCRQPFTLVRKKHYCRSCGGIFCAACTSKRVVLPKVGFNESARVCDSCFESIKGATNAKEALSVPDISASLSPARRTSGDRDTLASLVSSMTSSFRGERDPHLRVSTGTFISTMQSSTATTGNTTRSASLSSISSLANLTTLNNSTPISITPSTSSTDIKSHAFPVPLASYRGPTPQQHPNSNNPTVAFVPAPLSPATLLYEKMLKWNPTDFRRRQTESERLEAERLAIVREAVKRAEAVLAEVPGGDSKP
mmetsp:Transcript_29366/g.47412  ORF Transcript_29366/g.47412 Transcript_29366/m.47412 type:complete len:792 (-) Transcript_29366:878-3253(-)